MKFLIVADPIETLTPATDTGLSLLREALKRGHEVAWATIHDCMIWETHPAVQAQLIHSCEKSELPKDRSEPIRCLLTDFDGIWIRKDPPFDENYVSLCWLLALVEKKVPIINPASVLLRYHEKLLPLEAIQNGYIESDEIIPTYIVTPTNTPAIENLPERSWVSKPWLGHAGGGIQRWESTGELKTALNDPSQFPAENRIILQPFLQEIATEGDRRIYFLDGRHAADFVRIPKKGDFISNIAYGGTGIIKPRNARETILIKKLEKFLQAVRIQIAGVDMINGRVSEINITAPTGFQKLIQLGGPDLNPVYLNMAEKQKNGN